MYGEYSEGTCSEFLPFHSDAIKEEYETSGGSYGRMNIVADSCVEKLCHSRQTVHSGKGHVLKRVHRLQLHLHALFYLHKF